MRSASHTASRWLVVARKLAQSGSPVRNRRFSCVSLIELATSDSNAHNTVAKPLPASRSARAVPHAPAPTTPQRIRRTSRRSDGREHRGQIGLWGGGGENSSPRRGHSLSSAPEHEIDGSHVSDDRRN